MGGLIVISTSSEIGSCPFSRALQRCRVPHTISQFHAERGKARDTESNATTSTQFNPSKFTANAFRCVPSARDDPGTCGTKRSDGPRVATCVAATWQITYQCKQSSVSHFVHLLVALFVSIIAPSSPSAFAR